MRSMTRSLLGLSFNFSFGWEMIFFRSHAGGMSVKRVRRFFVAKLSGSITHAGSDRTDGLVFCVQRIPRRKEERRARRREPPKGSRQCNIKCFARLIEPETKREKKNLLNLRFFGSKITSARSNYFYGGLELPFRIPFASSEAIFGHWLRLANLFLRLTSTRYRSQAQYLS